MPTKFNKCYSLVYDVEWDDVDSGRVGIAEMAPMNTKSYQEPALVSMGSLLLCLVL